MNNKGFTLIELLAVIVILASISLVVVASISSSLERRGVKECEEQIELAKNAAKIYFSLANCDVNAEENSCSVTVGVLKSGSYFNENSKISKLDDNDVISFTINGYEFTGTGECH